MAYSITGYVLYIIVCIRSLYIAICRFLYVPFGLELRLRRSDESNSLEVTEYLSLPIPLVVMLLALLGPGEPC